MHSIDDTIAAIATASGTSGLGVVRVSGARALAMASAVFRGARLDAVPSHTLHHGWAVRSATDERPVDEVVAAVFRAPRSYTREDVVELSCHGGRIAAAQVLDALLRAGARLARPGEFTQRAFLSGRLDLAQAEAVADLIHAETESAHALAIAQLAGRLSERIAQLEEQILNALAEIEARVDFAEDVGGIEVPRAVIDALEHTARALDAMLVGSPFARAVREGVRVPIVGRPNVGKSSLFNALLGEDRALVAARPGTTRDRVSEAFDVGGVRVTLSDTAGLRDATEPVEAMGIARTRELLEGATIVLWVLDGSAPLERADRELGADLRGKRVLAALNKRDLGEGVSPDDVSALLAGGPHRVLPVSVARGDGVEAVSAALDALLGGEESRGDLSMAVSHTRHAEALVRARAAVRRACDVAARAGAGEIVALELREALAALGEITGKQVDDDLLDRIFSRFCVGK